MANEHAKNITIIVNAQKKEVSGDTISYEQVVNLAFNNNPPTGENVKITVNYSKGVHDASGSLTPSQSVQIKKQMVFNVKPTDRS